jgi:uncharacterized membrane protein
MTAELQAAAIIACAAIAWAAMCVALAANRSARHDRTTIDTDHARRLGIELERQHRRVAALEAHLARIGHQPAPLAPPRPASPPPTTGGRHDAHRARTALPEWVDTVRMPKSILGLAR